MQIALLIDCENAKPDFIDGILGELAAKGTINIRRTARKTKNELRGDTELMNVLRAAIEGMKDENGFAPMTRIGQYISNHSSLSSKNYGYARWSDLIRATEYFEQSPGENHQVAFGGKKARTIPAQPA